MKNAAYLLVQLLLIVGLCINVIQMWKVGMFGFMILMHLTKNTDPRVS